MTLHFHEGTKLSSVSGRYTWNIYAERLLTLSRVYGFWKFVSKLERREARRYIEIIYMLKFKNLVGLFFSPSNLSDDVSIFSHLLLFPPDSFIVPQQPLINYCKGGDSSHLGGMNGSHASNCSVHKGK